MAFEEERVRISDYHQSVLIFQYQVCDCLIGLLFVWRELVVGAVAGWFMFTSDYYC